MASSTSRRSFLGQTATALAVAAASRHVAGADRQQDAKFTLDLRCGSIGIRADLPTAVRLAHTHGFQSVTPDPSFLAGLSDGNRQQLLDDLQAKGLVWGAAGLPVSFNADQAKFAADMKRLPELAKAMQLANVTRVNSWISPAHSTLTYRQNFERHATRLRAVADVLEDHGQRFGLEYIGPKTLWASKRHSFVHSMAEGKELLSAIGKSNVGFVLDSWHWYTAHESVEDLRTLTNKDIVACDLNDAPAGVAIDEQIDNRRELPTATGVIDVKAFLSVLVEIGYDGPIRAEPFNRTLDAMNDDDAAAATAVAMRKAFALVGAA